MNTKDLLESLLNSAQGMAQQGRAQLEEKMGIPEQGAQRDAELSGLGKGALIAGVAAMLLGTKSGRKLTGTAVKLGGLAALGGLAYKGYQNWQQNNAQKADNPIDAKHYQPIESLPEEQADNRSKVILSALIAASKADGHIDDAEQARIESYVDKFSQSEELTQFVHTELAKPLDPGEIAMACDSPELANEVYLASMLVIDQSNFMEKTYLNELAKQLALDPDLVASLEQQTVAG